MRRYIPLVVLAAFAVVFTTTGFQCGSAEVTTAKLAMQQGQYDKAEASLQKEVAKNDKNEEAWFLLGQVRWQLKKYIEGNEAFDRALALSPTHSSEIAAIRVPQWNQTINEGVGSYNKGLHFSRSADSASFAKKEYEAAARSFQVATEILPDSALGHYLLGMAQASLDDYQAAERSFRLALEKKRDYLDAYRTLGSLYVNRSEDLRVAKDENGRKSELQKYVTLLEDARKIYPDEPDFISKLIAAYQALGNDERALAMVQEALAKDPNKREFVYVYGEYLLKRGDFEQSIDYLKKSLALKDTVDVLTTSANANLGIAYQNWGVALRNEATKKAEAASKTGKKVPEDLSYMEKFRSAVPYFERAVDLNPNDIQTWDGLAKLYTALNMTDKAKKAYDQVDRLMKGK